MNPSGNEISSPLDSGYAQRAERILATARSFLALGTVVALYFDPAVPGAYHPAAYLGGLCYLAYSALVFTLVQTKQESAPAFVVAVHVVDVLWAGAVAMLIGGPSVLPWLLFLFALVAAAYRWGLRETLATAGATSALFLAGIVAVRFESGWPAGELEYRSEHAFTAVLCLFMVGALFGYLADKDKQLRARTLTIDRLVARVSPEVGIRETLTEVLRALADLFGSRRLLLALHETSRERAFLWQAVSGSGSGDAQVSLTELKMSEREAYFFSVAGQEGYALRLRRTKRRDPFRLLALGDDGNRLRDIPCSFPESFFARYSFRSLLAVAFTLDGEWSGRLFLLDPGKGLERETDLRFLQALVREVGPALYGVHLLGRLRTRVRAAERSRIARELHDEVVQSLVGTEMRVDVLRRRATAVSTGIAEELGQIQKLLRQEVIEVRGMMHHLRWLEIRPEELLASVEDIVDRFRRETGIAARLETESGRVVALPPRVCGEVARIVQEALVNVSKHSGAQHVSVRFLTEGGLCKVVVEDDGRGFAFSGRLSQADLEHLRQGPRVLQERVRVIRGELAIESSPGHGARLEISVPQKG